MHQTMKKILTLCVAVLAIAGTTLKAQSLDDVLKQHFEAIGQDKLLKVNALVTTGKLNQQGMEIPFTQTSMRPNMMRIEGTFQGLSFIQTFNGTDGWSLNPFTGSTEAQPIPADQLKEMKIQADIDGMMYNWKEKGYTVTLEGTEDVEGTNCYKVKIVTPEGGEYTNYIDSDSFMIIKTKSKIMMSGAEVESESYYSNYLQVDGIAFPGKIENRYNGATGEVISIEKVDLNPTLDTKIFEKPGTN